MSKKNAVIVLAVLMGIVALRLLYINLNPVKDPNGLTVGVILPETGILAPMGQMERQAIELAVKDIEKTGSHLHLIVEDGRGDNTTVATVANKLIDIDKAKILITSTTGASQTVQPIAERVNVLQLAFCMSSEVAPKSNNAVRFYVGIEEESQAIIGFLKKMPRTTKVGILHCAVPAWEEAVDKYYIPELKPYFKSPVVAEDYEIKSKDFRAQISRLKNAGVQELVILGYGFEYPTIFDQLKELRFRKNIGIVGGWGFLYTGLPKDDLEGIYVAGPTYVFSRGTKGSDFETKYAGVYGNKPNFDAAFAYDMVLQLPEIWKMFKTSENTLKQDLFKSGMHEGVMGHYSFNGEGNMIVDTAVGKIHDGLIIGK